VGEDSECTGQVKIVPYPSIYYYCIGITYAMRKIFILCSLITFHCSLAFAQHDSCKHTPRPYADLSGGVGLAPEAVFMPSSLSWMGYMLPGFNANISGGIPVAKSNFGIAGQVSYYGNVFNMNKYMNNINLYAANGTVYTAVSYGSYIQLAYMVGAFAAYAIDKTTIEVKVMGGFESITLPNYNYTVTEPQVPGFSETDTYIYTTSMSVAFGAGLQIGYAITKNFSIIYNSDMVITNVPYNLTAYRDQTVSKASGTGDAPVFMMNAAIGLRYSFGQ
jgi:hypothetical protein